MCTTQSSMLSPLTNLLTPLPISTLLSRDAVGGITFHIDALVLIFGTYECVISHGKGQLKFQIELGLRQLVLNMCVVCLTPTSLQTFGNSDPQGQNRVVET